MVTLPDPRSGLRRCSTLTRTIRFDPGREPPAVRTALVTRTQGYAALEDAALCALAAEGDGSALEALYARYGRVSYALARRILADEQLARDVVQEVFLTLWRDATRYDASRGGFSTWLLTMTHHKAVDAVRREEALRRRRAPAGALDLTESGAPDVDDEVWSVLRRDRVRLALAELPDAQREALGLAYFGGYTQREIAKLTDTPLGTVKTRMLAGMSRLRDALAHPLGDGGGA
jgi:RNA polymerase sigma factor (sigma-70 family)